MKFKMISFLILSVFVKFPFSSINVLSIVDTPETQSSTYVDEIGHYFFLLNYYFSPQNYLKTHDIEVKQIGWDKIKEEVKNIKKYDVIIIWDAPCEIKDERKNGFWYSDLEVIKGEFAEKIKEEVKNGKSLIIWGGITNYGDGIKSNSLKIDGLGSMDRRKGNKRFYYGYRNSEIYEILPVDIPEGETLTKLEKKLIIEENNILNGINFERIPIKAYHKIKNRNGNLIIKTEDGDPILVEGKYGKGKIICFTLCAKGNYFFEKNVPPIWEGEAILLYRLINYGLNKKGKEESKVKENYKNLISIPKTEPFWYLLKRFPYLTNTSLYGSPLLEKYFGKFIKDMNFTGIVFQGIWSNKELAEKLNEILDKASLYCYDHTDFVYVSKDNAQIVLPSGEVPLHFGSPYPCPRNPLTIEKTLENVKKYIEIVKNKQRIIGNFYDDEYAWWLGYRNQYEGKPGIACYCKYCNEYFKKKTGKEPPFPEWKEPGYIAPKDDLFIKWCEIIRKDAYKDYNEEIRKLIKKEIPNFILSNYPGGYSGELDIIIEEVYLDCWREDPILTFNRLDLKRNNIDDKKPIWALIGIFWMPEDKSILPETLNLTVGLCLGREAKGIILWNYVNLWKPYFQHLGKEPLYKKAKEIGVILKVYGDLFTKLKFKETPYWILGHFGWINTFDNYYHIPPETFKDYEWNWYPFQIEEIGIPAIFKANIPAEIVTEKQLMSEKLFEKKAVFLNGLNYCREEIVENLEKFIEKGGKVYLDNSSKVKIKGAIYLPVDLSKWHKDMLEGKRPITHPTEENWWKAWKLSQNYINEAIQVYKKVSEELNPEIKIEPEDGVYSLCENGDCDYLFVYNTNILKENKIKIKFNKKIENIYEILGKKFKVKNNLIEIDLSPGDWTLFILSKKKIGKFQVKKENGIQIVLKDEKGEIFKGAIPFKISGFKKEDIDEFYFSTDNGTLNLPFEYFKNYNKIEIENLITKERK